MDFAPQQDWSCVEARTREFEAERLCARTPAERFAVYADIYNTLWEARRKISGDWQRLDLWRGEEKFDLRRRMVEAFNQLDRFRRE